MTFKITILVLILSVGITVFVVFRLAERTTVTGSESVVEHRSSALSRSATREEGLSRFRYDRNSQIVDIPPEESAAVKSDLY